MPCNTSNGEGFCLIIKFGSKDDKLVIKVNQTQSDESASNYGSVVKIKFFDSPTSHIRIKYDLSKSEQPKHLEYHTSIEQQWYLLDNLSTVSSLKIQRSLTQQQ